MANPDKLRIPYEDFEYARFDCVGRLPDGSQFIAFVTGAFPSGQQDYLGDDWQYKKKWLAVVHRFDADGNHTGSETRLGGLDIEGGELAGERARGHLLDMLRDLAGHGQPELRDIWVKMFSVKIDGVTHGLFYEQSNEEPEPGEGRGDWVMLEPCDIMFHPPWDSGEYST
jgi:hypothetical protein